MSCTTFHGLYYVLVAAQSALLVSVSYSFSFTVTFSQDVCVCPGNKLVLEVSIQDALHLNCSRVAEPEKSLDCSKPFHTTGSDSAVLLDCTEQDSFVSTRTLFDPADNSCALSNRTTPDVVLFVDRMRLPMLNDIVYNDACLCALREIQARLVSDGKLFRIVTMVCGLSFLPVQALKLGADRVLVIGLNPSGEGALRHLVKHNGFDDDRLIFSAGTSMEMDNCWPVLFVDIVDVQGCLRQSIFEDIALARLEIIIYTVITYLMVSSFNYVLCYQTFV